MTADTDQYDVSITVVANGYEVRVEKWDDDECENEAIHRFVANTKNQVMAQLHELLPEPLERRDG